ncbi:hypothetical protein [Williamsia sp. CHRR-6]|uniref:hypothetical protein n=1 Tax=Williamsia sp. CHRR-6 TaxID=2835871 RepID=UPI001BD973D7|nr:hypothetical protein [Williamsia sp. CHRR-6]MBT0566998.1 hypothetical protein [Williamsia sp. CHRR-6]
MIGAASAVGISIVAPTGVAHAAGPTNTELLDACDWADYCVFHPDGAPRLSVQPSTSVATSNNCTGRNQTNSIGWSHTTFSSNSLGYSFKFSSGAVKEFMIGYKVTYQHEWNQQSTVSDTTAISVPAYSVGNIYFGKQMETIRGTYEIHFEKPFYGHYIHYLTMEVTSPRANGQDVIYTQSRAMGGDRARLCG